MGILETRQSLIEENNTTISAMRAKAMEAEADELYRVAASSKFDSSPIELRCECGDPSCSAVLHVTPADVHRARHLGNFICSRGHEKLDLEAPDSGSPDSDWISVKRRKVWDEPLDTDTLVACLASETAEATENMGMVDAGLARLSTLTVTGTLVLGLFTTLRPHGVQTLPKFLLLLPLIPFAGLIWSSIVAPRKVRTQIRKVLSAGRKMPLSEVAERVRYASNPLSVKPGFAYTVELVNPPGVTYEAHQAYDKAKQHDSFASRVYLHHHDYLIFELQRQIRRRIVYLEGIFLVERFERHGMLWLLALLAVIVGLTALG